VTEKVSAEYGLRLDQLSKRRSRLQERERITGYTQLALAAVVVIWILVRLHHYAAVDLLVLVPVTAFVVLAVLHGRLIRAVSLCTRSMKFYE
jgi:hypothetical protein